jgi:hypothetical protein
MTTTKAMCIRLVSALLGVMGVWLLAPVHLQAQQTCDPAPFLAATSWTGSINVTVNGNGTVTDAGGTTTAYDIQQSISLSPVIGPLQGVSFSGPENAKVQVNETFDVTPAGVPTATRTTIVGSGFVASPPGGIGAVLSFDPRACTYSLPIFPGPVPGTVTTNGTSQPTDVGWGPLGSVVPGAPIWMVPLPASGTALTGGASFDAPALDSFGGGPYLAHVTATWSLTPTTDLDVIVSIPAYQTWRPTAGLNELETGLDPATLKFNFLEIQAQLVQKSTQQVVTFSPDKWTFSLVQVSHEPGVTMNWPDETQAGEEPDMTFDKKACATPLGCVPIATNAPFTITPSDPNFPNGSTTAELPSPDPFNYVSIKILLSPHDWGGWATLNVTATVGGNPILGHLQLPTPLANNPDETEILLPQRQAGSFIADSWKTLHGLPLSTLDADDSETNPNGDSQPGDGLTLYEEYRGFYMGCTGSTLPPTPEGSGGCQRVEGDPTKKDLFVVDTIPTIANGGVKMFKETSGLDVHYLEMTLDDVAGSDPTNPGANRVINFNHLAGPHEVDEHALVIQLGPQSGYSEAVGGPGLPKQVDHIAIESDYDTLRQTSEKYLDSFVAHELAHGVDAYHHGDIDGNKWWELDSKGNVIEKDVDANDNPISSTARTILVMTEDQDPASPGKVLVSNRALSLTTGRLVYVGNDLCGSTVVMHGQQSGDVASYMRYDAAAAYIPLGFPFVRFWVVEPFGLNLTDHPQGTGVNDPNRMINGMRRVRYGDAYAGDGTPNSQRGNDASQLDVNDNNKPIVKPDQKTCP